MLDYIKIGNNIRKLRIECDMSQDDLVEIMNTRYKLRYTRQRIGRIENGDGSQLITAAMLDALTDIFNCDVGYIVGEIEERTQENKYICNALGISEKALNKIKACCHSDMRDVFNALCEDKALYKSILPRLAICINDEIENSIYMRDYVDNLKKLDLDEQIIVADLVHNLATQKNNTNLETSIIDSQLYALSVDSTNLYKNIIKKISSPVVKQNEKDANEKWNAFINK